MLRDLQDILRSSQIEENQNRELQGALKMQSVELNG